MVSTADLKELLAQFGTMCDSVPQGCSADITGPDGKPDGMVSTADLLQLLSDWGSCVIVPDSNP